MIIYPIPGFSDPFSSITHLFGALIFLVIGITKLFQQRGCLKETTALSVFIFGIVFLLSMSGVFHLLNPGTSGRYVLKVLDHAGIFILIAATFTPIHIVQFKGIRRWGVLFLVWTAAITGLTLKSIYFNAVPETLGLLLYLGLGWLGALTGYMLYRRFGLIHILPIIYGALAYTLGAIVELIQTPILVYGVIGPHELFHVLVLTGISFHFQYAWQIAKNQFKASEHIVQTHLPAS